MASRVKVFVVASLVALAPLSLFAPIVPGLNLVLLCDQANVIAVGRVRRVRQVAETEIVLQGQSIPARLLSVDLEAHKILKGSLRVGSLSFSYKLPSVPIVSFGYEEVPAGKVGVYFLRESAGNLEVFDPYHPYVIATPGAPPSPGDLLNQVTSEVGQVLVSEETSTDDKEQAVLVLNTVRTAVADIALRFAARNQHARVRLAATAALIARNDVSELPAAVRILLQPPPELDPNLLAGLAFAVRDGVKNPRAIPDLVYLLKSKDAVIRRCAVSALRNTRDQEAIEPLTLALSDVDREVQYQAVIGLAEITGAASEWSPATDTFNQNPKKYLDYWRDWAKANK